MLDVVLGLVGLTGLILFMVTAGSVGRWLTVRALGVRGVPFPFGAGSRWCWTTASPVPQALGLLGGIAGMYAVSGALVAAGTLTTGYDVADEESMEVRVEAEGPAAVAGMRDGDRIVAVYGERVSTWDALRSLVAGHPREPLDVSVMRDDREVHVLVTPDGSGLLRVRPPMKHVDAGLGECLRAGVVAPAAFLYETARAWGAVVAGRSHTEVSGPVEIVRESRQATGGGHVLAFLGLMGAYILPFTAIAALFTGPGRRKKPRAT